MDTGTLELLIPLTAIVLGSLTVLIPVAGVTARFALKPIVEALAQYRALQGRDEALQLVERRFALMEDQVQSLERTVAQLHEEADFRRRLEEPEPRAGALPRGA